VLNQPFVLDLEAEGGATPYAWKVDDALPNGLNFSEDGAMARNQLRKKLNERVAIFERLTQPFQILRLTIIKAR
jgi:hypothetical protein